MRPAHRCVLATLLGGVLLASSARAELVFERKLIETAMTTAETELNVVFPFTNKGTAPVKILKLEVGCTCTTVKVAKTTWAPGESGEIALRFEPGDRQGLQRQGVVIKTDDPAKPYDSVAVVAKIPKTLALPQDYLAWKEGEPLEPKTMVIKAAPGAEIREVKAIARSARIRVAISREGDSFAVKVTPSPYARNLREAVMLDALLGGGQTKRSMLFVLIP
jgi:hypothetical protein